MRSEPSPELYPVVIESDRFVPGVLLVLSAAPHGTHSVACCWK